MKWERSERAWNQMKRRRLRVRWLEKYRATWTFFSKYFWSLHTVENSYICSERQDVWDEWTLSLFCQLGWERASTAREMWRLADLLFCLFSNFANENQYYRGVGADLWITCVVKHWVSHRFLILTERTSSRFCKLLRKVKQNIYSWVWQVNGNSCL